MPITKLTPENNYPYLEDRLKALEQAVPEAFADGKVNWDTLREVLGENLEDEGRNEYFGLNWPGKREARKRAAAPSRATLVPAPGEGVNEDTTENLFIEGDNLEVLKLLQKSYAGKIKMIYIDPPYNTGNDFIYNDNFTDPLEAYLEYTGAKDESGELLTTNTRADGRFHSRWLNMMYPRLVLARQLMSDDGVIFVSIDDSEVHNLRQMMNEIYGEENFVADIVVINNLKGRNDKAHIATAHERLLIFKAPSFQEIGLTMSSEKTNEYNQSDEKGKYRLLGLRKRGGADTRLRRPKLFYPIFVDPNKGTVTCIKDQNHIIEVLPKKSGDVDGAWRWGSEKVTKCCDELIGIKKSTGSWDIFQKDYLYLSGEEKKIKPKSVWLGTFVSSDAATKHFKKLMGDCGFKNPKSVYFIKELIEYSSNEGDWILDFFAGSCTTAHAVFIQNNEDKKNRHFIMVQMNEKNDQSTYSSIAEIGKERIRRALKEISKSEQSSTMDLFKPSSIQMDFGFKVYKYFRTNFKKWKPPEEENTETIINLFDDQKLPLVPDWKKEDLLSEILLLEGFPLTSKVTYLEDLLKNQVYRMSAPDFCAHDLFVCLDETIQPVTIDLLTMEKEDIFICLDSALSDELKARVQDKFNVHVI